MVQKASTAAYFVLFAFSVFFMPGIGCGSGSGGKIESVNTSTTAIQPNDYQQTSTSDSNIASNITTSQTIIHPALTWAAPTHYTDNTVINRGDLKEYRIYYGLSSRLSPTFSGFAGTYSLPSYEPGNNPGTIIGTEVLNLTSAIYYFSVTAVDKNGVESDYSNEVAKYMQR